MTPHRTRRQQTASGEPHTDTEDLTPEQLAAQWEEEAPPPPDPLPTCAIPRGARR